MTHKTEAHRLKEDRAAGSKQRASFKRPNARVKTHRDEVEVKPKAKPRKKTGKLKKKKKSSD